MIRKVQVLVAFLGVLVAWPAGATVTLTGNAAWAQNVFANETSASVTPGVGGGSTANLWGGNADGGVQTTGTTGLNDTRYFQVNWSGGATIGSIWMFAPNQSSTPNFQSGNLQYTVGAGSYQPAGAFNGTTGQQIFGYQLGTLGAPQGNVTSVRVNVTAPTYYSGGSPSPYYYGQVNQLVGLTAVTQRIQPTGFAQSSFLSNQNSVPLNAAKLYDAAGTGGDYTAGTGWYSAAPGSDPNPWAYNTWLGQPQTINYLLLSTGDQGGAADQPLQYSIYTLKLGGNPTQTVDWNWQFSVSGLPGTPGQMQLLSLPSSVLTEGVKIYADTPGSSGVTFGELIALEIVPEPSSILLLGLGGLLVWRRVRKGLVGGKQ